MHAPPDTMRRSCTPLHRRLLKREPRRQTHHGKPLSAAVSAGLLGATPRVCSAAPVFIPATPSTSALLRRRHAHDFKWLPSFLIGGWS